jgi:hypothetical protein
MTISSDESQCPSFLAHDDCDQAERAERLKIGDSVEPHQAVVKFVSLAPIPAGRARRTSPSICGRVRIAWLALLPRTALLARAAIFITMRTVTGCSFG